MRLFTVCADCGTTLQPTYVGQETHPTCKQTEAEKLARQFIDAIQRDDIAEADRLEKIINRPSSPSLGDVALWYASVGWPVLPLLSNDKRPATKHGLNDATTDQGRIKEWWSKHPESNIGIRTGVVFDVIDIDGPTGFQSLRELGDGILPDVHGKVNTPRGTHLYVEKTGDGNRAGVKPGIDYRGVGGFVVAPPSRIDFKAYSWVTRPSPAILTTH